MRVELEIDDELVRRVLHLTKETSVAEALRHVLKEFVTNETAKGFREIADTITFDPEYLAEREREHPGSIH